MLPIDLILVRHGESEWNVAQHRSRNGDNSVWTEEFRKRHSSAARLTDLGRAQARKAGDWLRANFQEGHFDRHYVSPYIRTLETAAYLGLQEARWYLDIYLRERDGGALEQLNEEERRTQFARSLELRSAEPFFWTPPNGESVATVCGRVDRVLDTYHRECSDKRVITVLHGEMMWGFRVRLERMSSRHYRELQLSGDPRDRLHNCQILHYTRRNPSNGILAKEIGWVRSINPVDPGTSRNEWETIVRETFTNDDLLDIANQYTRVLKS